MWYDVFVIVTLPLLWLLLNIFGFINCLLYQLCHAIPALAFSRQPVRAYIGTCVYGNGKPFTFGRVKIFINPKLSYIKSRGLCIYSLNIQPKQQLITLISAPFLFALLIVLLICLPVYADASLILKAALSIPALSSIICLATNLAPGIYQGPNNRLYYSDGYQLGLLLEGRKNYYALCAAFKHFDAGNYTNALTFLLNVRDKYVDQAIFGIALTCFIQLKQYPETVQYSHKFKLNDFFEFISADDHSNIAYAYIRLKDYPKALEALDEATRLNPDSFKARNTKGYVYIMLDNFYEARAELNKALFIDGNSAIAYANRAYSNLRLGKLGEARSDIDDALANDAGNAYAHLLSGLYHLEKGVLAEALLSFKRVKALDKTTPHIDEYIALAKGNSVKAKAARKIHKKLT